MRWVILADDWPPQLGGVATWGAGAARALAEAGCAVRVFCRHRPALEPAPGVDLTGVRGRSFGRRGAWWAALRGSVALARADAVLATTWPMAVAVAPLAARRGLPLHVVSHGSDATRPPVDPEAFRLVARTARWWAVSRYLVRALADRGVEARWIPSPVEPGPVGFDRGGPWTLVARATALKGGERFVRIVAEAGVRGRIVGDGPELGRWRALATELGASVSFLGALDREGARSAMAGSAVVALLSRADADGSGAEGLGLVLLEAASQGILTVGSNVGGIPEAAALVVDDPDDAVRSVARIREGLRAWEPLRSSVLGAHGREALARSLLA